MPKDGQTRLGWDKFDGGIELVPERAQPGQVLDARNIWAPYGPAERRPGTRFIQRLGDQINRTFSGTNPLTSVSNGDGTWTVTLTVDNAVRDPALPPEAILYAIGRPSVTSNGGITFDFLNLFSGPALEQLVYTTRVFRAILPYDPLAVSGGTGPFTAEKFLYTGRTNPFALAEIDWGGRLARLMILEAYLLVSNKWAAFFSVLAAGTNYPTAQAGSFVQPGVQAFLGLPIAGPTASRLSTIAQIPSFDVTYFTYNYTIYQLTPADGFAQSVVNTDPNVVGPRTALVTPIFSIDRLAQLGTPPRANIVVYALGFLFALDIVGEQYNVRWSAPIIGTGTDLVWPVVNFEPLDEDGGRPRAAKPLQEFLVVYQAFNIYTFVNDGVDPTTGQATFDPKRVVSGVGTESHNGVVEVQGRHLFPARDGFYAFDGSPIPQKLSEPIDQFYQRLGRNALATSRGVHWPEKHCVMWAVKQGGTADPRGLDQDLHYVILYDYIKNAWWIWDNVVGGGGLARMFATDVQAGIYILSSVAFLYRLTGNCDEVPHESLSADDRFETEDAAQVDLPAAYILTHRLGEPAFYSLNVEESWIEANTGTAQAEVDIIVDDDSTLDAANMVVDFTNENDILWGGTKWGQSKWMANKRRSVPASNLALEGKHVRLKIAAVNAFNRAWNIVKAAVYITKRFGRW